MGETVTVLYQTCWASLTSTSLKRELDLTRCQQRRAILYWAGTPDQYNHKGDRRYRTIRVCAATREVHRERGNVFITKDPHLVPRREYESFFADTLPPKTLRAGATSWTLHFRLLFVPFRATYRTASYSSFGQSDGLVDRSSWRSVSG